MWLIKGVTAVRICLLPSPLCTHTNTDALLCSSSSSSPPHPPSNLFPSRSPCSKSKGMGGVLKISKSPLGHVTER